MPLRPHLRAARFSLLLCLILACIVSTSAFAQNPSAYDLDFQHLQSLFAQADNLPAQAVALESAYRYRDFVSDTPALDAWFGQLASRTDLAAELRAEASRYVAMSARHLGNAAAQPQPRAGLFLSLARERVSHEALQTSPSAASDLDTLGALEESAGLPEARQHLDSAARLEPAASRWLSVARVCPNQLCRWDALQQAQRLAPKNDAASSDSRSVTIAVAEYYIGREQLEKARDLLLPLVAAAPKDFVARKILADLYLSLGLHDRARAAFDSLEHDFPRPIWLRRELAASFEKLGLLDRAASLAEAAFAENRDANSEADLVLRLANERHNPAALQRAYLALAPYRASDSKIALHLAALAADRGDTLGARQKLSDALAREPQNPALHQQLADLFALTGHRQQAEAELTRAMALFPAGDPLRYRLQWHSPTDAAADPDERYVATLDDLQSTRRSPSPLANVTALADIRIDRVQPNGLYSSRVQQFFRIENQQGAREFQSRSVQYSPVSDTLRILHARVHKSDGRLLQAEDAGETPVADTSVAMYYDVRSHALRFPSVEPGDVVEIDYRITPAIQTNPYGDYFGSLMVFRNSMPTALKRYVLVTPASRQFHMREVRMASPAVISQSATERIYRWDAANLAALPNEPRGPAPTSFAPYVHVSTFADFKELGRWYARLISPQLELDSTLREIASRIARENPDELARVHAVHQLVLRSTHYVALEFGVYSYKPYPVSQTYARRFGDCKDKASLMVALLRAVGIDADFALVRTRRMGDIDEQAASVTPFNHAIVYLPKYQLWLDGTAEYSGARELPLEDQGATAVTVNAAGEAVLRHIPVTAVGDNYTRRTLRAQVHRDGTIQFSGDTYTRGEDAPGLRREYEIPEHQRDAVRQSLSEVFPSVRLDNVEVQGAGDLEQDVTVRFRGVLDSFAGKSSVVLSNSWIARKYLTTLAPLGTRTQDLLLPAPWNTEEKIHFVLSPAAQVTSMPADTRIETPYGSALLTYQQRGREIVVHNSVQFRQLRITPAEYPDFRDFCSQVERAFRQEVKVSLR